MRVCFITNTYRPYVIGGAELMVESLVTAVASRGHQVCVLTAAPKPAFRSAPLRERSDGVFEFAPFNVYPYIEGGRRASPNFPGARAAFFALDTVVANRPDRAVAELCRKWRPDVVHTHNVRGMGIRILASAGRRVPLVHTVHDGSLVCLTGFLRHGPERPCTGDRWPCRAALPIHRRMTAGIARHLVAPSEYYLRLYRARGLFAGAQAQVIKNDPAAGQIAPSRLIKERMAATDRQRAGRPRIVFLGQLAEHKGLEVLLAAARREPRVDLVIAGEVPQGGDEHLRSAGATCTGALHGPAKSQLIASANAVCVPSVCAENDPLVISEALALGVPIVASGVGGIPERVVDEVNGLLVPPGNVTALAGAFSRLVDTPQLHDRISRGAESSRGAILHFMAEQYMAIYEAAAGRRA